MSLDCDYLHISLEFVQIYVRNDRNTTGPVAQRLEQGTHNLLAIVARNSLKKQWSKKYKS